MIDIMSTICPVSVAKYESDIVSKHLIVFEQAWFKYHYFTASYSQSDRLLSDENLAWTQGHEWISNYFFFHFSDSSHCSEKNLRKEAAARVKRNFCWGTLSNSSSFLPLLIYTSSRSFSKRFIAPRIMPKLWTFPSTFIPANGTVMR